MGIHQGHRDRMKQEFLQGGLAHFSEPRALELLLFFSRFQGDVNPLAHELLATFGSLAGVLDAPPEELAKIPGVGEKRRAELLKAFKSIKNIKSATLAELEDAVPKNTARAVYDFFHQKGEEPSCE